ncbi:hypothetical protein CONPUDRAFT_71608 [Coniophora puteana RWD-64-598 SS2]|uniref:Uncharacterized protein n=1 Tax=Coniophora puteana (strain RWD-64-598) TaxID=741705 RepID=A0A5M3MUY3_CONPW|nr:uncharacterized protein CONPUDRAFT_71608 [Coniophora puteana RWD-64-598 SS2]EIW82949.1 hypothetical protein CONPUDRAFT_71608 [Coniophora puteana RWD-64-598 SS2]
MNEEYQTQEVFLKEIMKRTRGNPGWKLRPYTTGVILTKLNIWADNWTTTDFPSRIAKHIEPCPNPMVCTFKLWWNEPPFDKGPAVYGLGSRPMVRGHREHGAAADRQQDDVQIPDPSDEEEEAPRRPKKPSVKAKDVEGDVEMRAVSDEESEGVRPREVRKGQCLKEPEAATDNSKSESASTAKAPSAAPAQQAPLTLGGKSSKKTAKKAPPPGASSKAGSDASTDATALEDDTPAAPAKATKTKKQGAASQPEDASPSALAGGKSTAGSAKATQAATSGKDKGKAAAPVTSNAASNLFDEPVPDVQLTTPASSPLMDPPRGGSAIPIQPVGNLAPPISTWGPPDPKRMKDAATTAGEHLPPDYPFPKLRVPKRTPGPVRVDYEERMLLASTAMMEFIRDSKPEVKKATNSVAAMAEKVNLIYDMLKTLVPPAAEAGSAEAESIDAGANPVPADEGILRDISPVDLVSDTHAVNEST